MVPWAEQYEREKEKLCKEIQTDPRNAAKSAKIICSVHTISWATWECEALLWKENCVRSGRQLANWTPWSMEL